MPTEPTVVVRIRRELLKPAKQAALEADMTLTEWLSTAVAAKLGQ